MSFRDDAQTAVCCRALLARVRLSRLWTIEGPTDEALELYRTDGGYLSSSERELLLICFAIWNSDNKKSVLGEVLRSLDSNHQEALWSLLLAQAKMNDNGKAVDDWIYTRVSPNIWKKEKINGNKK